MPMTYEIDPEVGLIRLQGSGCLTDREMIECIQSLRADPALRPDMPTLSDMREIEVGFSTAGIQEMMSVMRASAGRRGSARAAIVVSSAVAFGMGRMLEMRAEGEAEPRFRVFEDMDAARAWLGLD